MSAFAIYEKHPAADAYRVGGFYSPYALVSQDKRFTDAELMAEVWHECNERTINASNIIGGQHDNPYAQRAFQRSIDRVKTLHRFATRPHAAESDYL